MPRSTPLTFNELAESALMNRELMGKDKLDTTARYSESHR